MSYEPTSRGNPQQLTVNQHFHSAHSIAKFCQNDKVQVYLHKEKKIESRKKDAKIFCAKRAWDERAEKLVMIHFEDRFHRTIDTAVPFSERDHKAITSYAVLWSLRFQYAQSKSAVDPLIGITGSSLSHAQEEVLEKNFVSFVRADSFVPSRFENGFQIQRGIDMAMAEMGHIKWGLMIAKDSELLVSDNYVGLLYLPIAPRLAFLAGSSDGVLEKKQVVELNQTSIAYSRHFYFARDLKQCPVS